MTIQFFTDKLQNSVEGDTTAVSDALNEVMNSRCYLSAGLHANVRFKGLDTDSLTKQRSILGTRFCEWVVWIRNRL